MRLLSVLLGLLLCGALFAQAPAGGGRTTTMDTGTLMVNTAKGLFVLRAGVLAKFSVPALKQQLMMQVWGPMPAAPADFSDREATSKYFTEMQRRLAPALLLAKDNSILVVVGDGFLRVNQDTLKTEAMTDLRDPAAAPADANAGGGNRFGGFGRQNEPSLGYLLADTTLYLMRAKEMVAINITDGKILARTPLDKELQGIAFTMPNFGGNRGGNGGGNRGGGN
jgi:hypothetical protein